MFITEDMKKKLDHWNEIGRRFERLMKAVTEPFDRIEAEIRKELKKKCPGLPEEDLEKLVAMKMGVVAMRMPLRKRPPRPGRRGQPQEQ